MKHWKALLLGTTVLTYLITNLLFNSWRYLTLRQGSTGLWALLMTPSNQYVPGYLLLFGFVGMIVVRAYYQFEAQFGSLQAGNKATSRFSTDAEVRQTYKAVPYYPLYNADGEVECYPGLSGAFISKQDDTAFVDTDDVHSLTIGRTRSGKDETKALPELELISRSEEQPHIIYSTVKYDTLEKTKQELELRGYIVEVLNLVDLDCSFGYSPLDLISKAYAAGDIDEAVELCKTFTQPLYDVINVKDPIWNNLSMAMVNACILALCHEFLSSDKEHEQKTELITLGSVISMLIELSGTYQTKSETRTLLDDYFNTLPLDNPARQEYATIGVTTGQMRSSVLGTTLSRLQKFVAPKVVRMMNHTTFDFENLVQSEQPYAVFILLPDYTKTNYNIATTWIEQCYYYLSKHASQHGDRLPKRIRFILNEFGNLPAFNSMGSMVSVGGGRGMLFDFYVQDLVQLKITYGADLATFLESQMMNVIFITSSNQDTQEWMSKKLGNREVTQKSRSGHWWGFNKSISEQVETRPLMFPNELANLLEGEWVIYRTKRKNEQREDQIPYPIFNHGNSRILTAYTYLDDVFQRVHHDKLNIRKHHNQNWSTEQLSYFQRVIQRRVKQAQQAHGANSIEQSIQEVETTMQAEGLHAFARYATDMPLLDETQFSDQQLDTVSLEDLPLYQTVSQRVHYYFNELVEEFETIDSEPTLQAFIARYPQQFATLQVKGEADG
ncbi:MAG: type IV secretory system conjugative DNA transfer family protein [Aerococcaceae bacterium]|nr:type IV secretory system conjugative DNA transfer family protein [Aerococcaceae bacterium]